MPNKSLAPLLGINVGFYKRNGIIAPRRRNEYESFNSIPARTFE
jgi:hypothetical protein